MVTSPKMRAQDGQVANLSQFKLTPTLQRKIPQPRTGQATACPPRLTASQGGGGKYVERHRSRGKHLARERIERIIDPGTAFLELSPLAAYELYDGLAHSAGIVIVGMVHGRECLFVANDATVKGGSYYPLTVKSTSEPRPWPTKIIFRASISLTRAVPSCPCRTGSLS